MKKYFEQKYCDDCLCTHWLEVTRNNRLICHGESFKINDSQTHYFRRLGRGFEMIENKPLPLAWQFAKEAKFEEVDF